MKLPRSRFLHLAGIAAALPTVSHVAKAQAYPSRPVRIMSALPPGAASVKKQLLHGLRQANIPCPSSHWLRSGGRDDHGCIDQFTFADDNIIVEANGDFSMSCFNNRMFELLYVGGLYGHELFYLFFRVVLG